ncbi:MAG TPA: hypothetical protein ENO28_13030 [Bacteroidetes bacterium]|nr:hypothetical protein [Bacteroidota bacterium]
MGASKKKTSQHILISGASVAGLNTAFWLIKYGFEVTIVERSATIRAGGQGLDVRGPALEVAARMGMLEALRANSTKLQGMSIIEVETGEEIYRNTERSFTGGRFDSPDIEILRDDLIRLLLDFVGDRVTYLFNDTIVSISQGDSSVDVTFALAKAARFDLIIGADGTHSNVRKLVFGPEKDFTRYLGYYVGIFTIPNILGLDHWEVFAQHDGKLVATLIVKEKEGEARGYLGLQSEKIISYDYRDIPAQKELLAKANGHIGWEVPKIISHMRESPNFYFDAVSQIIMEKWSQGRVVLVGDAGYGVSLTLGQGTTVAMVGAYVLAGELAENWNDLPKALVNYEHLLRDYVEINQQLAYSSHDQQPQPHVSGEETVEHPDTVPDFGVFIVPYELKDYKF